MRTSQTSSFWFSSNSGISKASKMKARLPSMAMSTTANMCVNERSYRSLPEYPALLSEYGVRQLHVDIVRPESTGERDQAYLREIMPRYSDMAPYYDDMLAGFDRWDHDFDVNVGNLPYCILPKWGSRIHHGGQETVTKSALPADGIVPRDQLSADAHAAVFPSHMLVAACMDGAAMKNAANPTAGIKGIRCMG